MRAVDVLIIGGGPAGLAAGLVFARRGFHTLICERKRFPVDKVCGEGVLPTGVARLHSLGVAKHLPSADFHPFKGIFYRSQSGNRGARRFSRRRGLGNYQVSSFSGISYTLRRNRKPGNLRGEPGKNHREACRKDHR
jgi:menaquinone-9 beta-reductase